MLNFKALRLAAGMFLTTSVAALAQSAWVQVEAQPSLAEAQAAARNYAGRLENVAGFDLPGRWYGVALGPFSEAEAEARLIDLRARGLIPGDAFISDGRSFGRPFWPVGVDARQQGAITGGAAGVEDAAAAPAAETAPETQPASAPETPAAPVALPDETEREARASERALSREERMALQVALQWEGFYNSAIDGAFGPGTRGSMAAWQEANGHAPTGVLTTRQRAATLAAYQGVIDALAMAPVTDEVAGISIEMPSGMVAFDAYAPPFAHYTQKAGSGVSVHLISQSGDEATLGGLFEIMQTLKIVPLEGPRELGAKSFILEGANDEITSFTYAELSGGAVKGFTLVWPAGDDKRRALALEAMRASFAASSNAVLPDAYGEGTSQSIDLLAGLDIRRPDGTHSGFYVDGAGMVVSSANGLADCARITLDDAVSAEVVARDGALALLRPLEPLAPLDYVRFQPGVPRLASEVAVAGYSYGGRLSAPTMTYGTLAELQGLSGEAGQMRLDIAALDGDAGGPVFDTQGAVVGMLMAGADGLGADGSRKLPEGVGFAADMESLVAFLSGNGLTAAALEEGAAQAPEDLIKTAADVTVLVGCWN